MPPTTLHAERIDCMIWGVIQDREYELWVKKIEEIKRLNSSNALIQHLSENAIFVFSVLPGSAEAQVIWSGIVICLLIAHSIINISAKKYQNPVPCLRVIAIQMWDVFKTLCRTLCDNKITCLFWSLDVNVKFNQVFNAMVPTASIYSIQFGFWPPQLHWLGEGGCIAVVCEWMMIRMVGGWLFLLIPALLGSPGQRAVKWLLCVVVNPMSTMEVDFICLFSLVSRTNRIPCENKCSCSWCIYRTM